MSYGDVNSKRNYNCFYCFYKWKKKQDNYKIVKTALSSIKDTNSIQIDEFINKHPGFNCKGFIDNINGGHYVAWLKRNEYWFLIDSLDLSGENSEKGTIIKYTQDEFDNIFDRRTRITGLLFIYEKTADTVGANTTGTESTETRARETNNTTKSGEYIDGTMVCPKS